jgi:hypothetical protein
VSTVHDSTKAYSPKRDNPTTKPALHQDWIMSQATHATPAAFFEALLNTLVSFQPKTQRNTNHQRVERLAPGLWNHFRSVQPPVAQRTIRCRNMDVPATAREREWWIKLHGQKSNWSAGDRWTPDVVHRAHNPWSHRSCASSSVQRFSIVPARQAT